MALTVGDYVLQRLRDWDVRQVFAYPGDGINGLVAAFGKADNNPRFVQVRHEEMAASTRSTPRTCTRAGPPAS